jgi:integrase
VGLCSWPPPQAPGRRPGGLPGRTGRRARPDPPPRLAHHPAGRAGPAHLPQELGCLPLRPSPNCWNNVPDIRYANASRFDELPDALSAHDAALLARHVARPTAPGEPWQDTRNRAAVARCTWGPVSPAEVRALRTKDLPLITPAAVHLAGAGAQRRHIPLPGWAGEFRCINGAICVQLGDPGRSVATLHPIVRQAMGKVSHHEGVKSVLAQAGLDAQRWSAYSLRHSFALHALHRRVPHPRSGSGWE